MSVYIFIDKFAIIRNKIRNSIEISNEFNLQSLAEDYLVPEPEFDSTENTTKVDSAVINGKDIEVYGDLSDTELQKNFIHRKYQNFEIFCVF